MYLNPAIVLLVFPLLEIAVFILVGSRIGILATIGLVLLSSLAGAILLRWQGFSAIRRIGLEMERGATPARDLAHGAMILLAGILLLIPGFISGMIGLLLFVPAIRDVAWRYLGSRMSVMARDSFGAHSTGQQAPPDSRYVIDLDENDYSTTPRANDSRGQRESD